MFNIVLVEPEIPQNTGNIVRTTAAIGARLHLVRPLGFEISDKHLKRAGLDYWPLAELFYYDSVAELLDKNSTGNFWFASTKADRLYTDADYGGDCFVVFGAESRGLPEVLLSDNYSRCIRIPMRGEARSLNLSNSVAVIAFEAMRQNNFAGLKNAGKLTSK